MAWHSLHLLVLTLACSQLITSNASRTKHLFHEIPATATLENMKQMLSEKANEDDFIKGRMDIQINDYGPTGPNPYHTPKPPHV
ncbi:hypothetical protein Ancab_020733 [Ancistrocladus abbreviatus]